MSSRLVIFRELKAKFGIDYCFVHVRRLERAGQFPRRVQVGAGRVAWLESEVEAWIAAKAAARANTPVVA
jgi:prophage regulatory protein